MTATANRPSGSQFEHGRRIVEPVVTSPIPVFARILAMLCFAVLAYDTPNNWFSNDAATAVTGEQESAQMIVALVLASTVAFGFVSMINQLEVFIHIAKREMMLLAFVFLAFASTVWSEYPAQTLRYGLSLILVYLVGLWVVAQFRLADIILMLCIVLALGTILQFVFIFGLPRYGDSEGGWTGVFQNKNGLGRAATFAAFHFAVAAGVYPKARWFWIAMFGLAMAQIVGSTSGTALGTVLILLPLLAVIRVFRAKRTLYGAVAFSYSGGAGARYLPYDS